MKDLPPLYGRVLSVLVVWTFAMTALSAVSMMPSAKASSLCSQSSWLIGGDWTVTGNEVCEGTMYTMTGSLTVNAGATLELRDGGIRFAQTTTKHYTVNVLGTLILNHSVLTVTGEQLDPYLKLVMTVQTGGTLNMMRDSDLAFPGWFSTTGATFVLSSSRIKALDDVAGWTTDVDENDDAPALSFADSTVRIYDSRIQDLFEKNGVNDPRRSVNLTGSTHFIAINSYIGIDFANDTSNGPIHNTLNVATVTNGAFLFWPTFDDSQKPQNSVDRSNAINVTGTAAYIYRRVDITVIDSNGAPVDGATLKMTSSGTTNDAQYVDRSIGSTTPNDAVLTYLGRNSGNWKTTNPAGQATIPLASDKIDATGIYFWGNYNITATSLPHTATKQVGLAQYPDADNATNNVAVTLQLTTLVQPLADLLPQSMTYIPIYPTNLTTVTITITVANGGSGSAKDIVVKVYDNLVSPAKLIYEELIAFMPQTSTRTLASFDWTPPDSGIHSIIVVMDPDNTVRETNEGNNQNAFPLPVTQLGPDLEVVLSALSGFAGNPVNLAATINNVGDAPARGVVVNFYIDSETSLVGSNTSVPEIPAGGSVPVTMTWIPPSVGNYTLIVWADPYDTIPEPPPYDNIFNNKNRTTLKIDPAPNLISYTDDLGATDPFPTIWTPTPVTLTATIRNIGQTDVTNPFDVAFYVDGMQIGAPVPVPSLAIGDKRQVSSLGTWTPTSCGYHTMKVHVDSADVIPEGSFYEQDNSVTRVLQAFKDAPPPIAYAGTHFLTYLPVTQNIIISGHVTITDGSMIVTEPLEACGRVFIKVTGTLTLINSTLAARDSGNWPVVVYVSGSGKIESFNGSQILLNTDQGDGVLEVGGNGVVELTDTTVKADISAHGGTAFFNRVTFAGKRIHADTSGLTKIWDPVFASPLAGGPNYLALRSDDGSLLTPDIDLRNATLESALTSQLVFGGRQYAHLTDVMTTKLTRWWEGTITQRAKVTRFWWLTVEAVDGTGAVLRPEANTNISVYRLNTVSLRNENPPLPVPGDNIFGTNTTGKWPVNAPNGMILYKAPSEERFASVQSQYMNATYTVSGNATISGKVYTPDAIITLLLDSSTTATLSFSKLTPDLSVTSISFKGENGVVNQQPLNRPLLIEAVINNTGEIDVPAVWVNFYFTDVDTNGDHLMDLPNSSFAAYFIDRKLISVPLAGTAAVNVTWLRPEGAFELTYWISVVVDPPVFDPSDRGLIKEINELNNIGKISLGLYSWPDLHIEANQVHVPTAIQGNRITIGIDITNAGTNSASNAIVDLSVDGVPITPASSPFSVPRGGIASTELKWTPSSVGSHALTFRVTVGGDPRNTDYNIVDNSVTITVPVYSPPDIAVVRSDFATFYNMTQKGSVPVSVKIYNNGDTIASSFAFEIYYSAPQVWPPRPQDLLASLSNLNLSAQSSSNYNVTLRSIPAIEVVGEYQFTVFVDPTNSVGEVREDNNVVNVTLNVVAPIGQFSIGQSPEGKELKPGDTFTIVGQVVVKGGPNDQDPIPDVTVIIAMKPDLSTGATIIVQGSALTSVNGVFIIPLTIPKGTADGTYYVEFTSQSGIESDFIQFTVKSPKDPTILGLPLWMFLLIIIIIVVVIVAVVIYTKRVGLGKMVECGECGAFIPEDSVKCPKCGVEFEKDMAKCSNCQAWIPLDVKQCPECNVEFATGEVEMADYEQKMKAQYNEVKKKLREQAQIELGHAISDDEFESWWKKQPTFVTFEDWLREEEEMRKMGSKPCPSCGTLNSITATVCHKCGTLLKKDETKRGGRPPSTEERKEAAATEETKPEQTATAEPRPMEPIPKKVVVKKPVTPTVIQKKVVVKRPTEGEGTEGTTEGDGTGGEGT